MIDKSKYQQDIEIFSGKYLGFNNSIFLNKYIFMP